MDPRSDLARAATFGADRTATVQVPNPGIYEVELFWHGGTLTGGGIIEQMGANAIVTVPEEGAPAPVTVTPDAVALKRTLEQWKKRERE